MSGTLFDRLTASTAELHARTLQHPSVLGIGNGTLPEENFRFYIEQDYQFLRRYIQVKSLAIASTLSLPVATRLAELVHQTLSVEMGALRRLYASFGGNPDQLESKDRAPACSAYTNHLLSVANERNLTLTLAAILPCQWGYREIGHTLKAQGLPADERYAAWIEEYAAPGYGELVDWIIATLNDLAETSGSATIDRTFEIFRLSSIYEYNFWSMAWNREGWDK
jgi:thiaminase/transcriptional activator TenA